MANNYSLTFLGSSSVDNVAKTCNLGFSISNLPSNARISSLVFNYRTDKNIKNTTKTTSVSTVGISISDLKNIVVPFSFNSTGYAVTYASFSLVLSGKPAINFPYIPFYVSAPPARPKLNLLSTNPPDICGNYNLNNNTTSSRPDYSNLWLNCSDYNMDQGGRTFDVQDVYKIDLYVQSEDQTSNLSEGQVASFSYYSNPIRVTGSYTSGESKIYVTGNITPQLSSGNQYITGNNIFDSIKTTSISYDSENNRTVIHVNNTISSSSESDNILISNFLLGNSLNIGFREITDNITGETFSLVEDVNYTIYCQTSRLSSSDFLNSDAVDPAFFTNKINIPKNLQVTTNNNDDTIIVSFTPPSDALDNGLHTVDSYILTFGIDASSATFNSTNFNPSVFNSLYSGDIINGNVYAVTQLNSSIIKSWSDASASLVDISYNINNGTSVVGFQNKTTLKGKTFQAGYVIGLTASGLQKNNQTREYGKTGFYTIGEGGLKMIVKPQTIAVTVGQISKNSITPLDINKNTYNFNNTGSERGTYIPITVTGRIGSFPLNNAGFNKSPVSLMLDDIPIESFDLSSNDFDSNNVYTSHTAVTFKIKAYINRVKDFTHKNYGSSLTVSARLKDINGNLSSNNPVYLMASSENSVYNGGSTIRENAFNYKIQDFPDDISGVSLANYYYSSENKPQNSDKNYVKLTWSIANTDSKDGLLTGSIQRINYTNSNNTTLNNTQDVASSNLQTIFATNAQIGLPIHAELKTYTIDLNSPVSKINNIYNSTTLISNDVSFAGIGSIQNFDFVPNSTYSLVPSIKFQFKEPNITGIDSDNFLININYQTPGDVSYNAIFDHLSLTKNSNGFYVFETQSTYSMYDKYVPFKWGDNITIKVTPRDVFGQDGTTSTISYTGLSAITNFSAIINSTFSENPQITLSFQNGLTNDSYYVFITDDISSTPDVLLTDISYSWSSGVSKLTLQSVDSNSANYLPFTWGENQHINIYKKDSTKKYLSKIATTNITGVHEVKNLSFISNDVININNPYITVEFKQPDNLTNNDKYLITVVKTNSFNQAISSTYKFSNTSGVNTTTYKSLSLIGPDSNGMYKFKTQSTNSSNANYLQFIWGDNIQVSVQPINQNNELGFSSTINLLGIPKLEDFTVSVNEPLTDTPSITLSFKTGNGSYYAIVNDASDVTVFQNLKIYDTTNNNSKALLKNSTSNPSTTNYLQTFNWGDDVYINLYQKHLLYNNYFGAISTAILDAKGKVSGLTFAENQTINNIDPSITVKFSPPFDFPSADKYYITVTNTSKQETYKFSNAPLNNDLNNLILTSTGTGSNSIYTFRSQNNDATNVYNYVPFDFGDGFQVSVQTVDINNSLSEINTISLNALSAVSGLNVAINAPLEESPEVTLEFQTGNGSYFISVYDSSSNETTNLTDVSTIVSGSISKVVLQSTNSNASNYLPFIWGSDLSFKVYQKNLSYKYLGAVSTTETHGEDMVSNLSFVQNNTYDTEHPYITVKFNAPADLPNAEKYFIKITNNTTSYVYKFSNVTSNPNPQHGSLNLTNNSGIFTFESQSVTNTNANYLPFSWGDSITVYVQSVDEDNELGAVNLITLPYLAPISYVYRFAIDDYTNPKITIGLNNTHGKYYIKGHNQTKNIYFNLPDVTYNYNENNIAIVTLQSTEQNLPNYVQFDWGDDINLTIYTKYKSAKNNRYLGGSINYFINGSKSIQNLMFLPNDQITPYTPAIKFKFQLPDSDILPDIDNAFVYIKIRNITLESQPDTTPFIYVYPISTYMVRDENGNPILDSNNKYTFIFSSQPSDYEYGLSTFLQFSWGDNLMISVQYIDIYNCLSEYNSISTPYVTKVTNAIITSNYNMYYDLSNSFYPYINFAFDAPSSGSSYVNSYIAYIYVGFNDAQIIIFNGTSVTTQSFNSTQQNYLDFNYGDRIDIEILPIITINNVLTNYLGKSSVNPQSETPYVTLNSLAGVQNIQLINNETINTSNPYVSLSFSCPTNSPVSNYFQIIVKNVTDPSKTRFLTNKPNLDLLISNNNSAIKESLLNLITSDNINYTFVSQSSNPNDNNYLDFAWGNGLQIYISELDEKGYSGALEEPGLIIPAYNSPSCKWLKNENISETPYLTIELDVSGVDSNNPGGIKDYYFEFVVNDVTYTNMTINVATKQIKNGSINDITNTYFTAVPNSSTKYKLVTQNTDNSKSNYMPFTWFDKVVLKVYPIVYNSGSLTLSRRLGPSSNPSTTTRYANTEMTLNPVVNANYNLTAPYISLNAGLNLNNYDKYYVIITEPSNNTWVFTYDSSGSTNSENTITTIVTNYNNVPLTANMKSLNITVYGLNSSTNHFYSKNTTIYTGIGPVTPTINKNDTLDFNGYLTLTFSDPSYGTVSTTNPYIISIKNTSLETPTSYVYSNNETLNSLLDASSNTIFKSTAIMEASNNKKFKTQSYTDACSNYLPFTWGHNYTVTVYPVNAYKYIGAPRTVTVAPITSTSATSNYWKITPVVDVIMNTTPILKFTLTTDISNSSIRTGATTTLYAFNTISRFIINSRSPIITTSTTGAQVATSMSTSINSGGNVLKFTPTIKTQFVDASNAIFNNSKLNYGDIVNCDIRCYSSTLNHLCGPQPAPIIITQCKQISLSSTKSAQRVNNNNISDPSGDYVAVNFELNLNGHALAAFSVQHTHKKTTTKQDIDPATNKTSVRDPSGTLLIPVLDQYNNFQSGQLYKSNGQPTSNSYILANYANGTECTTGQLAKDTTNSVDNTYTSNLRFDINSLKYTPTNANISDISQNLIDNKANIIIDEYAATNSSNNYLSFNMTDPSFVEILQKDFVKSIELVPTPTLNTENNILFTKINVKMIIISPFKSTVSSSESYIDRITAITLASVTGSGQNNVTNGLTLNSSTIVSQTTL
jgi:hypothetical protein